MTTPDVKPRIPLPAPPVEDEHLKINVPGQGGAIWAVRIPRFLYDKWMKVGEGGVHLGTLVIDSSANPPKISLKIPHADQKPTEEQLNSVKPDPNEGSPSSSSSSSYNTIGLPPVYDLHVPEERAKNTWVFSETKRTVTGLRMDGTMLGKRKREKANPTLLGPVQHDCTLAPLLDASYLAIMAQRKLEASHARRPIRRLEDVEQDQGRRNMLGGGWGNVVSKMGKGMVSSSSRLPSSDKLTRLPRSQLRNTLFDLFSQKPYWGIGALRETTKQPDAWVREVLKDVASKVTEGAYKDLWELRGDWRELEKGRIKGEAGGGGGEAGGGGETGGGEGGGGEGGAGMGTDEEWDDEDDFEEVT